jgi:hypothetical protein
MNWQEREERPYSGLRYPDHATSRGGGGGGGQPLIFLYVSVNQLFRKALSGDTLKNKIPLAHVSQLPVWKKFDPKGLGHERD